MPVSSGKVPSIIKVPVIGTVVDGALLTPGVTGETDLGFAILAAAAGTDAIGFIRGANTSGDSLQAGTAYALREVELIDEYKIIEMEYDQTDTMAVTSNSGTTLTITSLEDDIDGSWIYNTTLKELSYLTASASGSATQKTAMGWAANDTCIKILRLFHPLVKYVTNRTKLGTDAAAGTGTVCILENYFEDVNIGKVQLDPTKHDNLTLVNPRFYSRFVMRNTAGHTID